MPRCWDFLRLQYLPLSPLLRMDSILGFVRKAPYSGDIVSLRVLRRWILWILLVCHLLLEAFLFFFFFWKPSLKTLLHPASSLISGPHMHFIPPANSFQVHHSPPFWAIFDRSHLKSEIIEDGDLISISVSHH